MLIPRCMSLKWGWLLMQPLVFSDLEYSLEERVTTQAAPLLCHTFLVCKILPRFLTYFIPQGLSLPWSGETVLEAV